MVNINFVPENQVQSFTTSTTPPQNNIYKYLFFVFFILFLVVTSVCITLLITKNQNQSSIETSQANELFSISPTAIPTIPQTIILTKSSDESVKCYQNEKYFIAEKQSLGDSYILIKIKTNGDVNYDCLYNFEKSDLEIKDSATYYLGLENNFLLIDKGTSPGTRGLDIYDLDKRTKIYTGFYSSGESAIKILNNTITFWQPTKIKATEENCPILAENEKNYFSSVIEEYIKMDLLTLKKESLKEFRCSPRQ